MLIFWYVVLYECFFGYLVINQVFETAEVSDLNLKNLQVYER